MDVFLGKVTQQAMNYAIRSGITITAGFAIKQSARLLKTAEATTERDELQDLQERLDSKIRIISPAIDMIELISARGNTSLESAVSLTKQLRWEIQQLGQRLQKAAIAEEAFQGRSAKTNDKDRHVLDLKQIAQALHKLLLRIEDAVPLINLAITASGASLSSSLPSTVSPSRLLQASTFLTAGDSQYTTAPMGYVQIGPTFTLSMYMLFSGHVRAQKGEDVRESTWKEVIHKAVVRLMRVSINSHCVLPGVTQPRSHARNLNTEALNDDYFPTEMATGARADEYAYQLVIIEDLNDDRVHTFEDSEPQPGPYGDIDVAGIREPLPIHEISKIFYADTGKILNIGSEGEANSPVLLLKRDPNAIPPRRMMNKDVEDEYADDGLGTKSSVPQSSVSKGSYEQHSSTNSPAAGLRSGAAAMNQAQQQQLAQNSDPWRLPADLDPEWMAFEVYTEAQDSDTETEYETTPSPNRSKAPFTPPIPAMTSALSRLNVDKTEATSIPSEHLAPPSNTPTPPATLPPIRTSLSLLETLLRLLSLQQFQQTSHLSIPDELLTFFLSESASTGAASHDIQERKHLREEARRRVGFDPYDESPVKRRGEEYQYRGGEEEAASKQHWDAEEGPAFRNERFSSPIESVGYTGPRYEDEGYGTRNSTFPSPLPPSVNGQPPSTPHRATSDTLVERWFRNQPSGSAVSTSTDPSPSPAGRPLSLLSRRSDGGRYGLRGKTAHTVASGGKGGSSLARPGTRITDEGLGTSSGVEDEKRVKRV